MSVCLSVCLSLCVVSVSDEALAMVVDRGELGAELGGVGRTIRNTLLGGASDGGSGAMVGLLLHGHEGQRTSLRCL